MESQDRLPRDMSALIEYATQEANAASSLTSLQEKLVRAIGEGLPSYDWTGFYMLDHADPKMLVLGPFAGAPTPHVRIPISQGICGAAVESGKTVVVDDVNADPRYLSCSISTKSEIVVPIYASGRVVGEIDIDSHQPAAFTDRDQTFLEQVARIVGACIERLAVA